MQVTQDHFNKNGDYHTYYYNDEGNATLLYEVKTIKVILKTNTPGADSSSGPNDDSDNGDSLVGVIVGSVIGGLVVIGIIIFLVLRFRRKSSVDTNDKKTEPLQIKAQLD